MLANLDGLWAVGPLTSIQAAREYKSGSKSAFQKELSLVFKFKVRD